MSLPAEPASALKHGVKATKDIGSCTDKITKVGNVVMVRITTPISKNFRLSQEYDGKYYRAPISYCYPTFTQLSCTCDFVGMYLKACSVPC